MLDFRCAVFLCFLNSYLSTVFKNKFDHTAESVLPTLINLIPNSAKVLQHCRIDKVAIQNWQSFNTELAKLRYRIANVAIQYCKVTVQNWPGCYIVLARL